MAGHPGPHAVQEDQGSPYNNQVLSALQSQVVYPRGGQPLPGRPDYERLRKARKVAHPSEGSSPIRGVSAGDFQQVSTLWHQLPPLQQPGLLPSVFAFADFALKGQLFNSTCGKIL